NAIIQQLHRDLVQMLENRAGGIKTAELASTYRQTFSRQMNLHGRKLKELFESNSLPGIYIHKTRLDGTFNEIRLEGKTYRSSRVRVHQDPSPTIPSPYPRPSQASRVVEGGGGPGTTGTCNPYERHTPMSDGGDRGSTSNSMLHPRGDRALSAPERPRTPRDRSHPHHQVVTRQGEEAPGHKEAFRSRPVSSSRWPEPAERE
ncbi:unnamed protein product, partial [Discosporangium mesarthrocarpum]